MCYSDLNTNRFSIWSWKKRERAYKGQERQQELLFLKLTKENKSKASDKRHFEVSKYGVNGPGYFSDSRSGIVQRLIGCKTTKRHFHILQGLALSRLTFTTALCSSSTFMSIFLFFFWFPPIRKLVQRHGRAWKLSPRDVTRGTDHLSAILS